MYSKLIGISYRALDLIEQGKEVKLEGFAITTVADVLSLDKTTSLTAVQQYCVFL